MAAVANSQVIGPGGGGGAITLPHWEVTYERQGHDYGNNWIINPNTGQPQSQSFDYDWNGMIQTIGAYNGTGQSKTVTMTSEGWVKVKFDWVGNNNPPKRLLVNISSYASGRWVQAGSASADNGIGSPCLPSEEWPQSVSSSGTKMRVLDGTSGHAEVKINSTATATSSGTSSYAQATAGNTSGAVLIRGLDLYAPGYYSTYRRSTNGETVYSHGGSYPKAVPELNLAVEQGDGSLSQDVIFGLPIVTRAHFDYEPCYTHVDGHAVAFTDHNPTEHFQWHTPMDNTSGTLPGWFGSYDIDDAGIQNFWSSVQETDDSITWNDANTIADASMTYTWSDGYSLTSKLKLFARKARDNYSLFKSINYTDDGQLTWDISHFQVLESNDGWTILGATSLVCKLQKRDALLNAGAYAGTLLVAAGAEFPGPWQVRLTCIALGLALAVYPVPDVENNFNESMEKFNLAITNTPANGIWIDVKPTGTVTEETMHEYSWRVRALPLYQTDWWVCDAYDSAGFRGQEEESVKWQKSVRYGYEYKIHTGPPPPLGG